jgi:hypothetical protein
VIAQDTLNAKPALQLTTNEDTTLISPTTDNEPTNDISNIDDDDNNTRNSNTIPLDTHLRPNQDDSDNESWHSV